MQFTSRDIEQVESTWQQFVPSATLQDVDPRRFRFDWRSVEVGMTSLVRYELTAQVHSRAEPDDQLLVCRVEAPDARLWSDRQTLDAGQPWLTDGTRVEARWDRSAHVRALVFDRASAEAAARQITGDDGIELKGTGLAPHSAADGARWEAMFSYIDGALADDTVDPFVAAEFERHALLLTLHSFPTTFSEALRRPAQRSAAPVSVRRALSYIDANAHLPITIDDIAAASFMSTRGLQYAFRRALDMTPTDALRRARLDGAHRDLRAGMGASVATVARRWGFSNSSRFAAAYRDTYGMPPTLPRS
ncbi:helix-turn-helix transcriptional regulator [Microbacterium sp. p3-SID336]|uniref:helix-turn-helix transcriptional regulator n=1 Tax=Microbacterium sp. p3-SID336 TaxID=2916212 RepID=UPI0021A719FA|nr:AraC family transcriptional regulator [Microbacterium sp. p3-SID336]MCT1476569.1 AraC family transcriptional regulator [Microbacterium sp. p3-SID336]